ncbi:MAG: matrixin family metalloprotease [Planctomycetota bacterium]
MPPRSARVWPALCALAAAGCGRGPAPAPEPAPDLGSGPWPPFTVRGRWDDARGLRYRVEDRPGPAAPAAFAAAIERAAATWSETGITRLLRVTDPEAEVDVTLGWRRGHHGACEPFGPTMAVAHTGPTGPGTFVHFDAARRWHEGDGTGDGNAHSLERTALHEFGHVLGLGHCQRPDAVMTTAGAVPAALGPADLAGLRSLYGDPAAGLGDDDLVVERTDGSVAAAVRGLAPADRSAHAVFDTDGDGRDELLIWRTDRAGNGALMICAFAPGPRLCRTDGPFEGLLTAGAALRPQRTADGQRLLLVALPNQRVLAHRLDDHGMPTATAPAGSLPDAAAVLAMVQPQQGDLDGDGAPETVARPTRHDR